MKKQIREITIETEPGFFHGKDAVRGVLIMSENSSSYKSTRLWGLDLPEGREEAIVDSWERETNGQEYKENFQKLCECASSEIKRRKTECVVLDGSMFSVRLKYDDSTRKVVSYCLDCHWNGLDYFAYCVRKLIPQGEAYPWELAQGDIRCVDEGDLKNLIATIESHSGSLKGDCDLMNSLFSLLSLDYGYEERMKTIRDKRIAVEHFDFEDVRAYLTYFQMTPRSLLDEDDECKVVKALKRLLELCEDDKAKRRRAN